MKNRSFFDVAFVGLFLLALAVAPGFAQDPDEITINVEVANVTVAVTDKDGKPVADLQKSDFELTDNGEKKEISFFSDEDAPVSYGIVYDLHPTTTSEIKNVLAALDTFTERLGPKDEFFLSIFNEYGSLNLNFIPTASQIDRHLSFGERNEPNSLYDAIFAAGQKLEKRKNQKRTLIIISDGRDDHSHHSFSELESAVKTSNIHVYAIILGTKEGWDYRDVTDSHESKALQIDESSLDEAALRSLSRKSGGSAASPQIKNTIELYSLLGRIDSDLKSRYTLGFYPTSTKKHKIRIRLTDKSRRKLKLTYKKSFEIEQLSPKDTVAN